ncbi:hypothetical protein [Paenibacillus arenilitoris]|uniref:Uncharacterized protein n=1 Tax=Paenibacillus arenilitoris TaxID=2772299 RepID=A0A927CNL7_9BACL|nr:hypothetical protein [Paenibacillus arenilitoris]MBD2869451.1 hypothetical protein [Paenibacillus arenilitoris]
MKHLPIGVLVKAAYAEEVIPCYLDHGFESFGLTHWQTTGSIDLAEQAKRVNEQLAGSGATISSLTAFGNPLTGTGDNADKVKSWERLIDRAGLGAVESARLRAKVDLTGFIGEHSKAKGAGTSV